MKRVNVVQLGFLVLLLGGLLYEIFLYLGFESVSSGIASQSILILLVIVWTGSYLVRVFSGKMTFNEQRKRYRQVYEELADKKLQEKLDSMSDEEKMALIAELDQD